MLKCTTVTLRFQSEKSFKTVYDIQIKDIRDAVRMVSTGDLDALHQMEHELKDMVAIVQNKVTVGRGYALRPIPGTPESMG